MRTLAGQSPVSLGELAREALAVRATDITAKTLTVDDEAHLDAWTRGSPALLSRMVQNMVDNAIVHNEESGWIRIATEHDDTETRLVVETGGRVLDQGQVDRLSQPFARLGADRTGPEGSSGLGLSIVASIVTAHGGRLTLLARPEGGLRVGVTLPAGAGSQGVAR